MSLYKITLCTWKIQSIIESVRYKFKTEPSKPHLCLCLPPSGASNQNSWASDRSAAFFSESFWGFFKELLLISEVTCGPQQPALSSERASPTSGRGSSAQTMIARDHHPCRLASLPEGTFAAASATAQQRVKRRRALIRVSLAAKIIVETWPRGGRV